MSDPQGAPLGFWLRTVDALFDSSMDELFAPDGVTRQLWQLLSTIQRIQPVKTSDVEDAMAMSAGEAAESPERLLQAMRDRGWVRPSPTRWLLTEDGGAIHARLLAKVAEHRARMFRGVSDAAYKTTVETLAQITVNLDPYGRSTPRFR